MDRCKQPARYAIGISKQYSDRQGRIKFSIVILKQSRFNECHKKKRKQNITLCFLYHGLNKKNAKKKILPDIQVVR